MAIWSASDLENFIFDVFNLCFSLHIEENKYFSYWPFADMLATMEGSQRDLGFTPKNPAHLLAGQL
jgi:hypothetical protein